jgi:hypothetical protein
MKTIERKLESTNGITVKIPEETREHFIDLMEILDSAKSLTDFKEMMEKHHYFSLIEGVEYVNLVYTAGKLKRTKTEKSTIKYRDDLYIQLAQNDLKNIKKEAGEMHRSLDAIYSKIYKRGK